jgi:hypothetical protein
MSDMDELEAAARRNVPIRRGKPAEQVVAEVQAHQDFCDEHFDRVIVEDELDGQALGFGRDGQLLVKRGVRCETVGLKQSVAIVARMMGNGATTGDPEGWTRWLWKLHGAISAAEPGQIEAPCSRRSA